MKFISDYPFSIYTESKLEVCDIGNEISFFLKAKL